MLKTSNAGGLVKSQPPQENVTMLKVKIIRATIANKQAVVEGQIVELSDHEAKFLIGIGKAVAVESKGKAAPIETAMLEPNAESTDMKSPRKKG